jgi:Bacterial membrane protein YfhO
MTPPGSKLALPVLRRLGRGQILHPRSARGRTWLALAVVALLACSVFSSALFSGKVLGGDDLVLYSPPFEPPAGQTQPANPYLFDSAWVLHPDMLEAREQLREFALPTWTADQGGGEPMLGTQQTAVFYPLNWISDVFPFWQSLEWVAVLKLILAGGGMLLFGRALGLGLIPSLFGAISFAFSAYLVGWMAHPHSNVYVLLPWLMLAGDRVAERARLRDAGLLALVIGVSLLGGQPESSLLVLLAAGLWWIFRAVTTARDEGGPHRPLARRLALFAGAGVAGLALAAVSLLPFAEMLGQAHEASRSQGPGPWSIVQSFVMPERWGRPDKFEILGGGGPLNYQERTAYFGALPLLLGVAALAGRPRARHIFFLVLGLLALGLAVRIPVYTSLASSLPGLDTINRTRALSVVTFAGATLGALGLQAVMAASPAERRRMLLAVSGVALLTVAWATSQLESFPLGAAFRQLPVLGHKFQPIGVVELASALRWTLLAAAGVALVALAVARPRLATVAACAAIALTAVDVVTLDRGYIPAIDAAAANPPVPPAIQYAQAHVGHYRVGGGAGLQPNLAERYELRGSRIHALPTLERRNLLWFGLGGDGLEQRLLSSPRLLASLYSVKFAFTGSVQLDNPGTTPVMPGLYENRSALPRAWIAYDWTSASTPQQALSHIKAGTPSGSVMNLPVIEGVPAAPARDPDPRPQPARFVLDEDRYVELQVNAKRPGYVVLADTYYPGWKATVDNHEVPIHPANVAFRAVKVPAGRHVVRFDYRPASVRIGLIVSVLALLAIVGVLILSRSRRGSGVSPRPAPDNPSEPQRKESTWQN